MDRKKASALVSLWMILLASYALVAPIPQALAEFPPRYWVMSIPKRTSGTPPAPLGNVVVMDSVDENPIEYGIWNFSIPPLSSSMNITFSSNWTLAGYGQIVNMTVPAASYVGITYMFKSDVPPLWFRFVTSMVADGHGWIFLNDTGDVDCHTWSNNTAAYWRSPSPSPNTKAANHGSLPSPGDDGVAGTDDDGFGDGTPDPPGSSILMLPVVMSAEYHNGTIIPTPETGWDTMFTMTWPQVFTTGNASTLVIEPDGGGPGGLLSQIDGANQSYVGQPWEYYAGLDHPGKDGDPHTGDEEEYEVSYGNAYWNAYVTYVCAWSLLDTYTSLGWYDNCFTITEKLVRDDCAIGDVNCDEKANIKDIGRIAVAFGATDSGFGDDGKPYTGDDKISADSNYDGGADLKDERRKINIKDIGRVAVDFGASLTSDGIIRP